MTDCNASLVVPAFGLSTDLFQMCPRWIEIKVQVEIDIDTEFLRQVENALEMSVGVCVGVGATADHVAAGAQGLYQQLFAAGVVSQSFLRENTERQIERPGIIAFQGLHGFESAQGDSRIDLDMRPHARRAMDDRAFDDPRTARIDILHGKLPLHRRDGTDGVAKISLIKAFLAKASLIRACMIMAAAAEQAGFVEMNVGVYETGQHEPAFEI